MMVLHHNSNCIHNIYITFYTYKIITIVTDINMLALLDYQVILLLGNVITHECCIFMIIIVLYLTALVYFKDLVFVVINHIILTTKTIRFIHSYVSILFNILNIIIILHNNNIIIIIITLL